ncbi:Odorant receptor Or29 [Rhyzopertha dominica]|nr:Odorant receptor Or29 [Rhyzopertha dominica]
MSNFEHLNLVRMVCIAYGGYWPVTLIRNNKIRLLYNIYHNFVYVYISIFAICQFIELCRLISEEDYGGVPNNIGYTTIFFECVVKMSISRGYIFSKLTKKLLELERKSLKEATHQKQIEIHHSLVRYLNIIARVFLVLGNLAMLLLVVSPRLKQENEYAQYSGNVTVKRKYTYVYSAWIPLDEDKYYSVIYGINVVAGYFAFFIHTSADLSIIAFMIFCIQQLRILRDEIYRFRETAMARVSEGNSDLDTAMLQEIKRCIRKHQVLIKFVGDVNRLISMLMFLNFITGSVQMGPILFEVVVANTSFMHQMANFSVLVTAITQMLLFYWHGNEIMMESQKIAKSIWESGWLYCNRRLCQTLHIVMMRAQKPLTLTVGPFYVMSTQTALLILKGIYSIATLFRYVYTHQKPTL